MSTIGHEPAADARSRSGAWQHVPAVIRSVSATIVIGTAAGAVIGGIGGRVVMRVLFLTSDDSVKGLTSDDGFEIGRFDLGDTAGLIVVTAFIGVFAALLFLAARPFLVSIGAAVVPAMAALYGVVGGALMVHRDGVDFNVLEPAALAIVLFVIICAAFGAVVAWRVNAACAPDGWAQRRSWWLLAPPLVALVFLPFAVVAFAAGAFNWLRGVTGGDTLRWRVLERGAQLAIFGLFVVGAVDLTRDAIALI